VICAPQFGIRPVPRLAAEKPAPCPAHIAARLAALRTEAAARAQAQRAQAPDVWL